MRKLLDQIIPCFHLHPLFTVILAPECNVCIYYIWS